jgi:DNA-binding NarL/FixJ family response regulator
MERHRPTILIADDHTLVAEACGKLLQPEFDVIGVVSDGRTLVQVASKDRPDVVLLDISMPELNGLDAMTQLKQRHRSIKVIFLTVTARPDVAAEAFRRGASGYVAKHCSVDELIVAVRSVLRGESFLSPRISKDEVEFLLRSNRVVPPRKHITAREREVLRLLVEGKATSEIGQVLQIKPGTVACHKYRMIEAL